MHISSTTALKQAPYVALIKKGIYIKNMICTYCLYANSAAQF